MSYRPICRTTNKIYIGARLFLLFVLLSLCSADSGVIMEDTLLITQGHFLEANYSLTPFPFTKDYDQNRTIEG